MGNEQSQPKREAMRATPSGNPMGKELLPAFISHHNSSTWVLDMELQDLPFYLLGFSLAEISLIFFCSLIPPFWNVNICLVLLYVSDV